MRRFSLHVSLPEMCLLAAMVVLAATPVAAQGIYQLWGTTRLGGTSNAGVIFSTKYDGTNLQKQVDMTTSEGNTPMGRLLLYNKKLYGMTRYGGAGGYGTLFEYDLITKTYTKKIDLDGVNGSYPEGASLVEYNNKLYGLTTYGGTHNKGVLFEYDPATNVYSKKFEFNGPNGRNPNGGMLLYNNKLYGLVAGNPTDGGVLFEYDPTSNTYTKKYEFGSVPDGRFPTYNLLLHNAKLYGTTGGGGTNSAGTIFEFDLATNTYIKLHNFGGGVDGVSPYGGLVLYKNKLYGTAAGGAFNYGILFDFDLSTKTFVKRFDYHWNKNTGTYPTGGLLEYNSKLYGLTAHDGSALNEFIPSTNTLTTKSKFTGPNGSSPVAVTLLKVPAPVAVGTFGSCQSIASITIDATNANEWVPITNTQGDAIAEINANGNILGTVTTELYVHNNTVRKDGGNRFYLDRNITITPQFQPSSPVHIRLYIKSDEYKALRDASNASGLFTTISSINDIGVFKNNDACSNKLTAHAVPITGSSAASWGLYDDYVLTASINSFSTFYFAGIEHIALPIQLSSFTATTKNNVAFLQWVTEEETDGQHFEVEHSKDGTVFSPITTIQIKGSGTTNNYQYNHQGLPPGNHYYKIKMVNRNGSISYSPVRIVHIKDVNAFTVQLLKTNRIVSQTEVSITVPRTQSVQLRLSNSIGQRVWQSSYRLSAGTHQLKLPVAMKAGYFILSASNGETLETIPFIK